MQRICFSVPKLSSVEHQMKTQHHFEIESEDARREVAQIRTMIVDLDRVARFLASDIVIEEERSRVADRSDPAYPILARTLAARRDNLKVTIATLQQRVEEILGALPEAIAAEKKTRRREPAALMQITDLCLLLDFLRADFPVLR